MATEKRILSGMRSSNPRLHIGNYEGALRNWVELQNEGYRVFAMVADWHALTTMGENAAEVSRNAREVAKDYIAAGIDPTRSSVFIQSHVKEHAELHLLFSMITPLGWLERTPTYKEKKRDLAGASGAVAEALEALDGIRSAAIRFGDFINPVQNNVGRQNADARDELILQATTFIEEFKSLCVRIPEQLRNSPNKGHYSKYPHLNFPDLVSTLIDDALSDLNDRGNLSAVDNSLSSLLLISAIVRTEGDWIEDELLKNTSVPFGLLGYPVLQTADILLYRPYGVPVGRDQAPHLEIGNDIAIRFNRLFSREVFQPYKYLIPEDENRAKLPGLDMRKMSKSYDNCIYLSDTEDQTAEKIKSAYTTPTKMRKTDPGIPEGCAVCQYLKVYSSHWEHQWDEDRQGLRGCMQNKKECTEAINEYFRPMRERRASIDDDAIESILRRGADEAREVASATMAEVRAAMGMY